MSSPFSHRASLASIGRVLVIVSAGTIVVGATFQNPPPTYRAAVDLIVTDVQIVDRDGRPVTGLTPDKFDVSINGKKHRVASADLLTLSGPAGSAPAKAPPLAGNGDSLGFSAPIELAPSRLFIIAVDTMSFSPAVSHGAMAAARGFLDRLQPDDLVALFAYPTGPHIDPTNDHAAIAHGLEGVMGTREPVTGQFNLRPSEIIDLAMSIRTGRQDPSVEEVFTRECGRGATDPLCRQKLTTEVAALASMLENTAFVSLGGLRDLLQALGNVAGKKTLVLVTAGMVASDRPGGRPDVSELTMLAGQDAARANVTVYTVFLDSAYLEKNSAEARRGNANRFTSASRDGDVLSRWFDQFSGTAGGVMIKDLLGSGEIGFDRIIRETSAYYRLGVEPLDADRDGRPHQMAVKVAAKNATVRGQSWVVVPERTK